jgi:hypothetical protein
VLDSSDIQSLTTGHIAALTTDHIHALTTDAVHAFTTSEFAALGSTQFAALTTDHIAHISTMDIAALTTVQMHALSTDQIVAFTTDQIEVLTTHDLAALSMTQVAAFTSDQIGVMSSSQVDAMIAASPIVLDLNGDGVSTTNAHTAGVNFDLTATGKASTVGWASSTDGLLSIDLNHDGQINNGTELFGVGTQLANGTRAANGYQAMAQYDSNGDGKLTAADAHFADLRVWVDANHDGKTETGELKTLGDLHITSLDLHGLAGTTTNNGNLLGLTSSYTTADGTSHDMADVWFAKAPAATAAGTAAAATTAATPALHELLAAPATDLLPGHTTDAATTPTTGTAATTAHTAQAAEAGGLIDHRLLGDDEATRHGGTLI